jgi:hypothetical protein
MHISGEGNVQIHFHFDMVQGHDAVLTRHMELRTRP